MRILNNWSDFIKLQRIPNINHNLLVQSSRLSLLARITMLGRKYGNGISYIGRWDHNASYSDY